MVDCVIFAYKVNGNWPAMAYTQINVESMDTGLHQLMD